MSLFIFLLFYFLMFLKKILLKYWQTDRILLAIRCTGTHGVITAQM